MQTPKLLNANQVAELCRVSVSTVAYWARTGVLKEAMRGTGKTGERFFRESDVRALLAKRQAVAS